MDAYELFRKLGAGAKFDLKRFSQDAARFKVSLHVYFLVYWLKITERGLIYFANPQSALASKYVCFDVSILKKKDLILTYYTKYVVEPVHLFTYSVYPSHFVD